MTAMMAFFLVMWLLAQSTDMERELIADYFRMPIKPSMSNGNKTSLSDSVIPGGGDDILKQQGDVFKSQINALDKHKRFESLQQAKEKLQRMIETDPRLNNLSQISC